MICIIFWIQLTFFVYGIKSNFVTKIFANHSPRTIYIATIPVFSLSFFYTCRCNVIIHVLWLSNGSIHIFMKNNKISFEKKEEQRKSITFPSRYSNKKMFFFFHFPYAVEQTWKLCRNLANENYAKLLTYKNTLYNQRVSCFEFSLAYGLIILI